MLQVIEFILTSVLIDYSYNLKKLNVQKIVKITSENLLPFSIKNSFKSSNISVTIERKGHSW